MDVPHYQPLPSRNRRDLSALLPSLGCHDAALPLTQDTQSTGAAAPSAETSSTAFSPFCLPRYLPPDQLVHAADVIC
jgi:hypothetical protein